MAADYILTFSFLTIAAFYAISMIDAFGAARARQRPTYLNYNIPRKTEHGNAAMKNYSPFNSHRVKINPSDFILSEIASSDVVIFSMTNCHHCIQTKQLMTGLNVNAKVIELDQMKNGLGAAEDSIAMNLYKLTGQTTVPNVFVKGKHLGGNEETQAAASCGKLQKMLTVAQKS